MTLAILHEARGLEKIEFLDEAEKIWGNRWEGALESDAARSCPN